MKHQYTESREKFEKLKRDELVHRLAMVESCLLARIEDEAEEARRDVNHPVDSWNHGPPRAWGYVSACCFAVDLAQGVRVGANRKIFLEVEKETATSTAEPEKQVDNTTA